MITQKKIALSCIFLLYFEFISELITILQLQKPN